MNEKIALPGDGLPCTCMAPSPSDRRDCPHHGIPSLRKIAASAQPTGSDEECAKAVWKAGNRYGPDTERKAAILSIVAAYRQKAEAKGEEWRRKYQSLASRHMPVALERDALRERVEVLEEALYWQEAWLVENAEVTQGVSREEAAERARAALPGKRAKDENEKAPA